MQRSRGEADTLAILAALWLLDDSSANTQAVTSSFSQLIKKLTVYDIAKLILQNPSNFVFRVICSIAGERTI